jgi:ferredoxin
MPRVKVRFLAGHPQANDAERTLDVLDGETLLDALGSRGVFVQTLCGGALDCRTCVVFIDADANATSTMGKKERTLLSEKSASESLDLSRARFSCQVRVRGDLVVTVPGPTAPSDDGSREGDFT